MAYTTVNVGKIIVITVIFIIFLYVYNTVYKTKYGDMFKNIQIFNVPDSVKCYFGEEGCEEGDIDGWSLIRFAVFFIVGLIIPDYYFTVLALSIIYEIIVGYYGYHTRYIINPLINMTAYAIGSIVSPCKHKYMEKYKLIND